MHGAENVLVGALLDIGEPLSDLPLAEDVIIHEQADAMVMWPSMEVPRKEVRSNMPKSVSPFTERT